MNVDIICPLCKLHEEIVEHIFFTCNFNRQIWLSVTKFIHEGVESVVWLYGMKLSPELLEI